MYTELYAAWVDMKALLNFLSDRKLSGSVMIRSAAGTGVIILAHGELAGAYTSESRDIADKPDRALALCDDPNAMIEVKSADTSKHPPLDVDEVVGAQRGRAPQPAPAQAPPQQQGGYTPVPAVSRVRRRDGHPAGHAADACRATDGTDPDRAVLERLHAADPADRSRCRSHRPRLRDWPPARLAERRGRAAGDAEDSLGNRARKVKDILGAAEQSLSGIEAAIDQIPSISLLFVDSSRLEQLAQEMRARLKSHL
jgi:hypothetical protein